MVVFAPRCTTVARHVPSTSQTQLWEPFSDQLWTIPGPLWTILAPKSHRMPSNAFIFILESSSIDLGVVFWSCCGHRRVIRQSLCHGSR